MITASQISLPDGRVELRDRTRIEASPLYNEDLAPVPLARRNWTTYNYAALWISMAHCIPTYMLASGLIASGHEIRHPLPRLRAGGIRHHRIEPAGADARARRLRLVRDPGVDRRRGA